MFDECGLELWPEMTTRGRFCPHRQHILILFAHFICGIALPAHWMIVTEAIYDVRESYNFPRIFDTHFTIICIFLCLLWSRSQPSPPWQWLTWAEARRRIQARAFSPLRIHPALGGTISGESRFDHSITRSLDLAIWWSRSKIRS